MIDLGIDVVAPMTRTTYYLRFRCGCFSCFKKTGSFRALRPCHLHLEFAHDEGRLFA